MKVHPALERSSRAMGGEKGWVQNRLHGEVSLLFLPMYCIVFCLFVVDCIVSLLFVVVGVALIADTILNAKWSISCSV